MFTKPVIVNRESIYGLLCQSSVGPNKINFSNGTAFMVAPNICITASHVLHIESDKSKPIQSKIELIRCPEIGTPMKIAKIIAEDIDRDIAILEILNTSQSASVTMNKSILDRGSSCGSLGFPLANVQVINNQISFNLVERFQSASISAFQTMLQPNGKKYDFYETDSLMYGGSSGCPGFSPDGVVFGMHVATISEGSVNSNSSRLAISLWIPSTDIIDFAKKNGIKKLNVA
jgi:hypothetical protein